MFDSTYHNGNGLPDYYLSRFALPITWGIANYNYDLEVSNACGGFKKTGHIQVYDTSYYPMNPVWVDTAANWTVTPIPCCLNTLTLQNMQIIGDVSYIVRNEITIQNGVSVAPGSNVIIQAGNVVEMDSVEFDGTNSTVEILEVPCPNRMAGEEGCCAGISTMVIDSVVILTNEVDEETSEIVEYEELEFVRTKEVARLDEFALKVFPNPASDALNIDFHLPDQESVTATLITATGIRAFKVVEAGTLASGDHTFSVALKDVPSGMYFLQLRHGDRLETAKVLVQR